MMSAVLFRLACLVLPLFFLLCPVCPAAAQAYVVQVDSIAADSLNFAANPDYVFRPGREGMVGVNVDDLRFREVAELVASCLASRGMREVADGERADAAVYLSYGVGDERREIRVMDIPGPCRPLDPWCRDDPFFYDSCRRRTVRVVTTWLIRLDVSAYSLNERGERSGQLWSTRAECRSSSRDERAVLPWLVEAMRGDFASDTHGIVSYEVRLNRNRPPEIRRLP